MHKPASLFPSGWSIQNESDTTVYRKRVLMFASTLMLDVLGNVNDMSSLLISNSNLIEFKSVFYEEREYNDVSGSTVHCESLAKV